MPSALFYVRRFDGRRSPTDCTNSAKPSIDSVEDGVIPKVALTGVWGSYVYKYNALNNIIKRTGTNVWDYVYTSDNRLTRIDGGSGRTYQYNDLGQVTADGVRTYTWNAAHRITAIQDVASYVYDGWGNRVKTTDPLGQVEYTVYAKNGLLLYSYKPTSKEFTDFIHLGSKPVAEVRTVLGIFPPEVSALAYPTIANTVQGLPPQVQEDLRRENKFIELQNPSQAGPALTFTTAVYTDLFESPVFFGTGSRLTNANTEKYAVEQYDPFGVKLNGVRFKLGYTGQVYDEQSRLTYMKARYYDPEVGRFLSADPVGFNDRDPFTFNRYAYANNNPYRFTDPSGKSVWSMLARLVVKGGDIAATTAGVVEDFNVLTNPGAEPLDRVMAGASLISELSPVSARDFKTVTSIVKKGPPPNGGIAKPHGGQNHNADIDAEAAALRQEPGVTNIRKNQQQVDVDGNNVGRNRPDLQYDKSGTHHCCEFDTKPERGIEHEATIRSNDPDAVVHRFDVKK